MRKKLYRSLSDEFHNIEMEQIFDSGEWRCQFIKDEKNQLMGLVEISSRNIVDGCLSSPVAYLEGLYLKSEYRSKGLGRETMSCIMEWCDKNGFSELATDTDLTNTNAQEFYRAIGFEETDRIVAFRIDVQKSSKKAI